MRDSNVQTPNQTQIIQVHTQIHTHRLTAIIRIHTYFYRYTNNIQHTHIHTYIHTHYKPLRLSENEP